MPKEKEKRSMFVAYIEILSATKSVSKICTEHVCVANNKMCIIHLFKLF